MKCGYIAKSFETGMSLDDELAQINKFTRRSLKTDEVFTFPLVLCSNEIDRDNEQFSVNTLKQLSQLYIGKTGIADHNPSFKNQFARIYWAEVREVPNEKNSIGEPLYCLYAKAYMVRSNKNSDLILDIEAGINKEISVGCSIKNAICSICGTNNRNKMCEHIPGENYNHKLCYRILGDAKDAYEWSFVAVPAQKQAGVIKYFEQDGDEMFTDKQIEQIKSLTEAGKQVYISKATTGYSICEKPQESPLLTTEKVKSEIGSELPAEKIIGALKSIKAAGIDLSDVEKGLADLKQPATDEETTNKAKAYDKLKEDAMTEAVKSGVRAKGEKFDEDRWKKLMKGFSIDEINAQASEWDEESKDEFHAGKRFSSDNSFIGCPSGDISRFKI